MVHRRRCHNHSLVYTNDRIRLSLSDLAHLFVRFHHRMDDACNCELYLKRQADNLGHCHLQLWKGPRYVQRSWNRGNVPITIRGLLQPVLLR